MAPTLRAVSAAAAGLIAAGVLAACGGDNPTSREPATPVPTARSSQPRNCTTVRSLIAYTDDYSSVYTVNVDGSNPKRVGPGAFPSFAPDGRHLAVTVDGMVVVIDIDSGRTTPLTEEFRVQSPFVEGVPTAPSYSPDGTLIAYTRAGGIYVMDADGRNRRRILEGTHEGTEPRPPNYRPPEASGGRFSPDGRSIVYTDSGVIWTIAVDGSGNRRRLTSDPFFNDAPSYSPDGSQVVAPPPPDLRDPAALVVVDANGRFQRSIRTPTSASLPAWGRTQTPVADAAIATSGRVDPTTASVSGSPAPIGPERRPPRDVDAPAPPARPDRRPPPGA